MKTRPLFSDSATTLPLLMTPAQPDIDVVAWVRSNVESIRGHMKEHGGILFRGCGHMSSTQLQGLLEAISPALVHYTYRSTPRTQLDDKIYSSTEYPADQIIPMHNEMSYAHAWPRWIAFGCVVAAATGGETPIADSHRVYQAIPDAIRRPFIEKGVRYVRNYGPYLDLTWQEVFQTTDRETVEALCREAGIVTEWLSDTHLRTSQTCQAVVKHPETGDALWFNQAHLFHMSRLPAEVREMLLAEVGLENMPRNAFFGDGSPITDAALTAIRQAYQQTKVMFTWQEGDILILDNMQVAHGRQPFTGDRKIIVGMAELYTPANEV